jgi:predicted O-methyltransferase YrrM
MSILKSPIVSSLLERLYSAAGATDTVVLPELRAERQRLAGAPPSPQLSQLASQAYMPVSPEVGRLLYQMVRAKRPQLVVEFGLSHGISAIHLAAALLDNRQGRLITTELYADKAERARQNLREAGLLDRVEIRVGDALETLKAGCGEPIDVLLLDGWKPLYLPMLRTLEAFLAPGCLVIADDTCLMPKEVEPYLAYVRDPLHGAVSVALPLDDGLELSTFG